MERKGLGREKNNSGRLWSLGQTCKCGNSLVVAAGRDVEQKYLVRVAHRAESTSIWRNRSCTRSNKGKFPTVINGSRKTERGDSLQTGKTVNFNGFVIVAHN